MATVQYDFNFQNKAMNLQPFDRYGYLIPPPGTMDWGLIRTVDTVDTTIDRTDAFGNDSTEFDSVSGRTGFVVTVDLITRFGRMGNIPFMFAGLNPGGASCAMPAPGQMVLIGYVSGSLMPVAIGGFARWQEIRRMITTGILPELKAGEVIHQAGIRPDAMSWFKQPSDGETDVKETAKGARVWLDYKGRLIMESRHSRGGKGATVQVILGNPAASQADDEQNDFTTKDAGSNNYVALQLQVTPADGSPSFMCNVDDLGNVAFQFAKGWFGRAVGEGNTPVATLEVDVTNRKVVLAGDEIKVGRGATEAMVLGDTLHDLLSQLVDLITGMRQPVAGAGPTAGPPTNMAQFIQLKNQLDGVLSTKHKVE